METIGLTQREQTLFSEVHNVMQRFPDLADSFGVWRVHEHFSLNEDEILHETCDADARVLTTRVKSKSEIPSTAFPSQWKFSKLGEPEVVAWCCD